MSRSHRLAVLACAALLAACAGPDPTSPPVPEADAVAPGVAAKGDTLVVTGSGFGGSGTVTVGGAQAEVVAWSTTAVQAVVPEDAPSGWQEVAVSTAGGRSAVEGLFVGVEYDDVPADLQGFLSAQEPGTAVLLQAATYDLGDDVLWVDNVSLHGRGPTLTTLLAGGLTLSFDEGAQVTVADLGMYGATVTLLPGTLKDPVPSVSGLATSGPATATEVEAALRAAVEARTLEPADLPANARVSFERFLFTGTMPSTIGTPLEMGFNLELRLFDTRFTATGSTLQLLAGGRLTVENSTLEARLIYLAAPGGAVHVGFAEVVAQEGLLIGADRGVEVLGSTARVVDGDLEVVGSLLAAHGSSTLLVGGPVNVADSSLSAEDADVWDADIRGGLGFMTALSPMSISDNVLLRGDASLQVVSLGAFGENDIRFTGNGDVRVGRMEVGLSQDGELIIGAESGELPADVVVTGNTIASTYLITLTDADTPVRFTFADNALTLGNELNTGELRAEFGGESWVELSGNTVSLRHGHVELNSGGTTTLTFAGNQVHLVEPSSAGALVRGSGDVRLADNVFDTVDPFLGTSALWVQLVDEPLELTATGNTFAGFEIALNFAGPVVQVPLDARVNDNVFDMEFTALPQVASLHSIGDVIDATSNVWGDETDAAVLATYVALSGNTGTWGGGIDIDPVKTP